MDKTPGKTNQIADDTADRFAAFYEGHEVFCTGATGILGITFVCSLVFKTPVRHIYALARGGNDKFWQTYRSLLPADMVKALAESKRISVMAGDIDQPGCGMSDQDAAVIRAQASIVVHAASSINLLAPASKLLVPIHDATRHLALLALDSVRLVRFVFVSTAASSMFLRRDAAGSYVSPAIIDEDIRPIVEESGPTDDGDARPESPNTESPSTESPNTTGPGNNSLAREVAEVRTSGRSTYLDCVRHTSSYTYIKHLTERVLVDMFVQRGVPHKLLIFRPCVIGPSQDFPFAMFERPGSCPITLITAMVLCAPPGDFNIMTYGADPYNANLNDSPVDIIANGLITHIAHGSSHCVHSVPGRNAVPIFVNLLNKMIEMRGRNLGELRLKFCPVESKEATFVSQLFHMFGINWVFSDDKTQAMSATMTDVEKRKWPLWCREDLWDTGYIANRRKALSAVIDQVLARQVPLHFVPLLRDQMVAKL